MPSCSKAPWGLSVLVRVNGIFTAIAISPSPSLRQCPYRYAIRAGRNLPDKEFRSNMLHILVCRSFPSCNLHVAMQFGLYLHHLRGVRRIVSEDSHFLRHESFLLIVRTDRIITSQLLERVPSDTRGFQHIARFSL